MTTLWDMDVTGTTVPPPLEVVTEGTTTGVEMLPPLLVGLAVDLDVGVVTEPPSLLLLVVVGGVVEVVGVVDVVGGVDVVVGVVGVGVVVISGTVGVGVSSAVEISVTIHKVPVNSNSLASYR